MEGFDGGGFIHSDPGSSCHDPGSHTAHQHDCKIGDDTPELEVELPDNVPRLMIALWLWPNVVYIATMIVGVAAMGTWEFLANHLPWFGIGCVACFAFFVLLCSVYAWRVERYFTRIKNPDTRYGCGMLMAFSEVVAGVATLVGPQTPHINDTWYSGLGACWGLIGGFLMLATMWALNPDADKAEDK